MSNELVTIPTKQLEWEVQVKIPHELRNTTNARRITRLKRDRTAIEQELKRRGES